MAASDISSPTPALFNDASDRRPPVAYKLPELIRKTRQEQYQDYYAEKICQIREYFGLKGYETSDAFLDVLLELKEQNYNWRKDGYTPEYGHEIDLLLARISAIESGQIDVEAAEKEYGSIESMLISAIVHDLGEDFGLMPKDVQKKAHLALSQKIGASLSSHHMYLLHRGAQSMERLTHDRHYTPEEFLQKFGEDFARNFGKELEIPTPKPGEFISLDNDAREFLWEHMNILEGVEAENGEKHFQAFAFVHKGKPRITVTRYGKANHWGACWHAYSQGFMSDPYDAANKFGDSANGMTSRLSIESFKLDGANRYLQKRDVLFKSNGSAARAQKAYPEIAKDLRSTGSMMVIAKEFASLLFMHDPLAGDEGESGFSIHNYPKDENGVICIDLQNFPAFAFDSYTLTPGLSHPIARFMQQYRDVVQFYDNEDHPWLDEAMELYEQTRAALVRDCAEACRRNGLNIERLIDNPEQYDPMPTILENLNHESHRPAPEFN